MSPADLPFQKKQKRSAHMLRSVPPRQDSHQANQYNATLPEALAIEEPKLFQANWAWWHGLQYPGQLHLTVGNQNDLRIPFSIPPCARSWLWNRRRGNNLRNSKRAWHFKCPTTRRSKTLGSGTSMQASCCHSWGAKCKHGSEGFLLTSPLKLHGPKVRPRAFRKSSQSIPTYPNSKTAHTAHTAVPPCEYLLLKQLQLPHLAGPNHIIMAQ